MSRFLHDQEIGYFVLPDAHNSQVTIIGPLKITGCTITENVLLRGEILSTKQPHTAKESAFVLKDNVIKYVDGILNPKPNAQPKPKQSDANKTPKA